MSFKNTTIVNSLKELGMGENEAFLYEVLLKIPEATIPILRKNTPFSRTMLYYVLDNLLNLGLIQEKKQGSKTIYIAEHPSKLQEFVSQQQQELNRQKRMLEEVLPDLSSYYRLGHNRPGVRFFEGKEGFKEALLDSLSATETIYTYANVEEIIKYADDVNKDYVKKRQAKGLSKKLLVEDTPNTRSYLAKQKELTDYRFLPKQLKPFKTGMQIYNNKISYMTIRPENIIAVIVEDPDIYQMHRNLFEYLWNISGPIKF